ncbi:SMI1/KNR4 family protein [Chitinophaga sp.]|uniref:SMI1/KNR4 family protein n=1 Tax=Chitinophaga sp. TaxID=1869181 RepID=UPI002F94BD02
MNDTLLNKIKNIERNPSDEKILTDEGLEATFTFNKGATENGIAEADGFFKNNIPTEFIEFLKLYNGCILFNVDGIGGFQIFSDDKLVSENKFQKLNFEDDWDDNVIIFCSCIGDGDYIGFRLLNDGYEIIDCFGEEIPLNWLAIETSFDVFLEKLIDHKGGKYWLSTE